jgi:hypothetical protein
MKRTLVIVGILLTIVAILLLVGTPPPPQDALARVEYTPPAYFAKYAVNQWAAADGPDTLAFSTEARYWRLMYKTGTADTDSVQVSIHVASTRTWSVLNFPGGYTMTETLVFNGPGIDSVIVAKLGTTTRARLERWY